MKKAILLPVTAFILFSCNQPTKTTVEKVTETTVKSDTATLKDTLTVSKQLAPVSAANDTITPGKSIGHISLDEKTGEVIAELNKPDGEDAAMGKALLTWNSKPSMKGADTTVNSINIFTSTNFGAKDEASRVKHIRVTSAFFKTPEHAGCGSTIAFIKMQYPEIKKPAASYTDKAGKTVLIYDDIKTGIAFEINDATKCIGVTVHKPGEKAWETYISEFGVVTTEH